MYCVSQSGKLCRRLCYHEKIRSSFRPRPISISLSESETHLDNVLDGAALLGDHAVMHGDAVMCDVARRPLRYHIISKRKFAGNIINMAVSRDGNDINVFAKDVSDTECARISQETNGSNVRLGEVHLIDGRDC